MFLENIYFKNILFFSKFHLERKCDYSFHYSYMLQNKSFFLGEVGLEYNEIMFQFICKDLEKTLIGKYKQKVQLINKNYIIYIYFFNRNNILIKVKRIIVCIFYTVNCVLSQMLNIVISLKII